VDGVNKKAGKAKPDGAVTSVKPKPGAATAAEERSPNRIDIVQEVGKTRAQMFATLGMSATHRHAAIARVWSDDFMGGEPSDIMECTEILSKRAHLVRDGNVDVLTDTLVGQMAALDTLFSAMMQRAAKNIGTYPQAVDRYMNIALKAQANCRVTAETIAKIKRGGKQTVQVTHVYDGGQAVVADIVNTGGRLGAQAEGIKQSDEQAPHDVIAALSGPDPARDGVPLPGAKRKAAVPTSRRAIARGAQGEP